FKGKEVGCASGRAFVTVRSEDDDDEYCEKPTEDDFGSTSESSGGFSNTNRPLFSDDENDNSHRPIIKPTIKANEDDLDLGAATSTDRIEDGTSGCQSQSSGWISTSFSDDRAEEELGDPCESNRPAANKINPRENRSRLCFVFFALLALICVPLILVFSYRPMKDATESSDQLILDIRDTMNQVEASLNSIESASMSALEIVNATPTDLAVVCPMVSVEALQSELGVDLTSIVHSIADEYDRLKTEVTDQLSIGNKIVDRIESGVAQFEDSVDTTEEYMWAVPALLFGISILCAVSILGVIMAWKEKAGVRFQRVMSYIILPLLVLASIACWIVVVLASAGSMVGTGEFHLMLEGWYDLKLYMHTLTVSTFVATVFRHVLFEFQSRFSRSNNSRSPITPWLGKKQYYQIDDLEQDIQNHIDNIWRQMSQIDSVGRAQVIAKCGAEGTFSDMLSGARNLAKLLTAIRRSLSTAERSLKCNMINPIYAEAAHVTVCTSALRSTVNGFILFLVVSICIMVMISLRASWLRHIQEEKVYHDEDEVAENMILDEHEEYLAYISKYKHEWQEYEGFEEDGANDDYMDGESYYDDEEDEYSEFDETSEISGIDSGSVNFTQDPPTTSYEYDNAVDGATYASGEVSFLSLSAKQSEEDSQNQIFPEELLAPPADLLLSPPPPLNPEHILDANVHSAAVSAIPLHHASTAPVNTQSLSMPRKAFYGTSARRSYSRSFSAKANPRALGNINNNGTNIGGIDPPSTNRSSSDNDEVDDDEGFEVMMR
ncbi:MAG: hypothetical protein SGILL_003985, partial [Bacillariaceae sp.]